ncbi:MAG: type III secretion protein [Succinatimonas hippei]|nr:type III secretion protein [Succinatimonas hippei]
MITYPLQSLKQIRKKRLDDAQNREICAKKLLEQTVCELESKQKELEDYRQYRFEETTRRYDSLLGKIKKQKEIHEFNAGIASLAAKELELQESITKLEAAVEDSKKEYEKSKSECIKARKALGKIEKHEEVWTLFEKRKEEISEEKELEDFKTRNIEY